MSEIKTFQVGQLVKIWDRANKAWETGTVIGSNGFITAVTVYHKKLGRDVPSSWKTEAVEAA